MEKKKGQSSAGEERVTGRVTRGHVKCNYAAALSHTEQTVKSKAGIWVKYE